MLSVTGDQNPVLVFSAYLSLRPSLCHPFVPFKTFRFCCFLLLPTPQWVKVCRVAGSFRESIMTVMSPRGVLQSLQGQRCLLAGWQLVNYRHQTKLPGAWRYLTPTDLLRYGLHVSVVNATCWPALCTLDQALKLPLFLYLSHTHKNQHMLKCCFCWFKSLLAK